MLPFQKLTKPLVERLDDVGLSKQVVGGCNLDEPFH